MQPMIRKSTNVSVIRVVNQVVDRRVQSIIGKPGRLSTSLPLAKKHRKRAEIGGLQDVAVVNVPGLPRVQAVQMTEGNSIIIFILMDFLMEIIIGVEANIAQNIDGNEGHPPVLRRPVTMDQVWLCNHRHHHPLRDIMAAEKKILTKKN